MRSVLGLLVYASLLLGLAYACASSEHGLVLPWMFFFAPISGLSYRVPWDGPVGPVIAMFLGVGLAWPLAGLGLHLVPSGRRRPVARVGLLVHYASAIALGAASLNPWQRAILATRAMGGLVGVSFAIYAAGQVLIWRRTRSL